MANQRTEVFNYQADESTNPKRIDPPAPFLSFQWTEILPEMAGQLQTYLRKVKIAQEKAGDQRTIIRRTNAYGTGFTMTAVTPLSKLGDRDATNPNLADAMRKAFGDAEAAELQPIGNRAVRSRQTLLLNYRADLSHAKATALN